MRHDERFNHTWAFYDSVLFLSYTPLRDRQTDRRTDMKQRVIMRRWDNPQQTKPSVMICESLMGVLF